MFNYAQITIRTNSIFASFPGLQELHFRGNRVQLQLNTPHAAFFVHNTKLQYLDLSDNDITDINPPQFASLHSLKTLVLSDNSIETVSFVLSNATCYCSWTIITSVSYSVDSLLILTDTRTRCPWT